MTPNTGEKRKSQEAGGGARRGDSEAKYMSCLRRYAPITHPRWRRKQKQHRSIKVRLYEYLSK